jgi:hypothetical protein
VASDRRPRKSRPDPPAGRTGQAGPPGPRAASAGIPPAACTRKPLNPPVTWAICQRRNALVTVSHRLLGPRTTPSMGQDPSNQDTAVEIRSCPAGLDTVRQRAESVRTTMSVRRSLRSSMGHSWAPAGRQAASADSTKARGGHLLTAHRSTPEHAARERASGVTPTPGPDAAVAPRPERGRRIYRTVR